MPTIALRLVLAAALTLSMAEGLASAQSTQTFVSGAGWTVTTGSGAPAGSSVNVCLTAATPANCPAGSVIWGQPLGGYEQDLSPIPGATWIWASGFTGTDNGNLARFTFTRTVTIPGPPTAGTVYMTGDDLIELRVNGTLVSTYGSITDNLQSAAYAPLREVNVLPFLVAGPNTFAFTAQNGPGTFSGDPNANYSQNPAAVVFGGTITSGTFTTVQPPTDLYTAAIDGNVVTMRWTPPANGPAPTGYVLKGGVAPGQVLASLPTGSTASAFQFTAPSGSFFVRLHALQGGTESAPSTEIPLVVNTASPPSPPADLLGVTTQQSLTLSWRPTLAGGPPTSYLLDVTGGVTTSLPLATSGTSLSFTNVPPGAYSLRLRAVNASGASAPSAAIPVTVPSLVCQSAPLAPQKLVALVAGRQVTLLWEAPASGRAVTGYSVKVSGAFTTTLDTSDRRLTANAPPGTFTIRVAASNVCGVGPDSAPYTFTVQ